ncbi:MAG: DUF2142 domain-containing protein [Parvularculaceae bacterium]
MSTPHGLYTALAGLFGLAFLVVTPPSGAFDEPARFLAAYEVATGSWFGAEKAPAGLVEFHAEMLGYAERRDRFGAADFAALRRITLRKDELVAPANPLRVVLRVHHPLASFAYAPAMRAGLALNLNPFTIFVLCKLTTFAIGFALMREAIKATPSRRYAAALIALAPTSVFLLGAMNFDAILLGSCFLDAALLAKWSGGRAPLSLVQAGALCALGFAIGSMKLPYAILPLLALIAPRAAFDRFPGRRVGFTAAATLPGIASGVVWALFAKARMFGDVAYTTPDGDFVSPSRQLEGMLDAPFDFLRTLAASLFDPNSLSLYLAQAIGFIGWNRVMLPGWVYVAYIVALGVLFFDRAAAPRLAHDARALVWRLTIAGAVVSSSLALLYLQWSSVGASKIAGYQGRYLLPIAPLLLLAGPTRLGGLRTDVQRAAVVLVVAAISLAVAVGAIWTAYRA